MKGWRSESVLDLYNVALAAVIFVSPWLFRLTNGTATKDFWITAAAIVAIALAAIIAYANWEEWANFLVGIWLVSSPWILGFSHTRAMHFAVGFGAAVTFLAALELWLMYEKAHPQN
ncbi:MAG TPA: SPW repeat protein [Bradyrhizobium sp.]|uniref:SPW repeat protein n=1 Tax=Bradyrhizobium sp. TaxID=376 RepID=UPI002CC1E193|nr:SPW repeat protein [Bradyrhizobium sp.]HLZ06929.1 SPW repeat protein [Bradyrhizobium sp.]